MKALAINGSPRAGGNTEYLLKKVLEPIAEAGIETDLMQIGGKLVHGCIACYKCRENKDSRCSIKNDVVNDFIAKMIESDAVEPTPAMEPTPAAEPTPAVEPSVPSTETPAAPAKEARRRANVPRANSGNAKAAASNAARNRVAVRMHDEPAPRVPAAGAKPRANQSEPAVQPVSLFEPLQIKEPANPLR